MNRLADVIARELLEMSDADILADRNGDEAKANGLRLLKAAKAEAEQRKMTEDERQQAAQKHIAEVKEVGAALLERLQTIDRDNKQLAEDLEDAMHIIDRQGQLLDGVAVALKGPNPPRARHSFHDLPEWAARLTDELTTLRAKHGDEKESGNG